MARKPRIDCPEVLYHVLARGNQRQAIFRDEGDYRAYLERLLHYQQRYRFYLYAYVLMPNHVHLLMERQAVPLAKIVQGLHQSYTLYFNRRYRTVGHLFQGRYKAFVCDKEAYLLELVRYIHLNPVRARLVQDPRAYPWSSHRLYLNGHSGDAVTLEPVLGRFAARRGLAVRRYQAFIAAGLNQKKRADLYAVKEQRILGEEEFVKAIRNRAGEDGPRRVKLSLEAIESVVGPALGVVPEEIHAGGRGRRGALARSAIAYLGRELAGIALTKVARRFGRDPVTISLGVKRFEEGLREDPALRRCIERVQSGLRRKGNNKNSNV